MSVKIHQFDPQIYPRLVWVVIGEKKSGPLSERFEEIDDMDESTAACVKPTYDRINKKGGILIRFATRKYARDVKIVCHEAAHAALAIFDYTDCIISPDNQEPFCYLVGWIAQCIRESVKSNQ